MVRKLSPSPRHNIAPSQNIVHICVRELGTRCGALENSGLVVAEVRLAIPRFSNERRICELYQWFSSFAGSSQNRERLQVQEWPMAVGRKTRLPGPVILARSEHYWDRFEGRLNHT
jgi:hypothetical protein